MPGTERAAAAAAAFVLALSVAPVLAPAQAPRGARAPAVAGLCQCIDNRRTVEQMCLGSPQACQAACSTGHYSFVPDAAQSCAAH